MEGAEARKPSDPSLNFEVFQTDLTLDPDERRVGLELVDWFDEKADRLRQRGIRRKADERDGQRTEVAIRV
jgi:hypothetical protein